MHIDVYADYLIAISLQTPSRALRALLTRGGSKSVRIDNRYTENYGPNEVMLNIDEINIYTKTMMIKCDEDLAGQIYVCREELKVRSLHWALCCAGRGCHASMYVLDISGKKTQLRGLLDKGAVLSVIPKETWRKNKNRAVRSTSARDAHGERPIAYKVLSDTKMKHGAPKAEIFAVVTFVEKYRAYLGSEPFKLRVDNRSLSWLKTWSMDQS